MATRHERRRTMRGLLRTWQRSGERAHAFCVKRGIPISTFFWWKRRLHSEPAAAQDSHGSAFPAFLQVGPSAVAGTFQYRFPDGGSLVLPGTLGLSDVAALVRQLRGGS